MDQNCLPKYKITDRKRVHHSQQPVLQNKESFFICGALIPAGLELEGQFDALTHVV